jgi:predicted HicB family RNase H-like nuclease
MDTRKDVHPTLKGPKKYIQLRDVPPELHHAIKVSAVQAGVTMEEFILCVLAKAVK